MGKAAFRQADVRRACQAVEAVGKSIAAVDFMPDGRFRLLLGEPVGPSADGQGGAPNEWDEAYGAE